MNAILQFCLSLARARIVRALSVGVVAVVVQTAVFELLAIYWGIFSPSTAVIFGAECGILTNFFLNHHISFHDRKGGEKLPARLARFHLVVSVSVALQWIFVFITEHETNNLLIIHSAYAAGIVIGFVFNYTGYRLWVWKHHPPEI